MNSPLSILDQWQLHAACWRRDGKTLWHLKGIARPVMPVIKAVAAGLLFLSLFH